MTRQVAERVKTSSLPPGVFLDVNVPPGPIEAIKGLRLTTQSRTQGTEKFEERKTPSGRRYFWNIYEDPKDDKEGTDVWATTRGFAAVVPLRAEEFDPKAFESLRGRFP
jgi:5'-nucleotidase